MDELEHDAAAPLQSRKAWTDPEIREQTARSLTSFSAKALAPFEGGSSPIGPTYGPIS